MFRKELLIRFIARVFLSQFVCVLLLGWDLGFDLLVPDQSLSFYFTLGDYQLVRFFQVM